MINNLTPTPEYRGKKKPSVVKLLVTLAVAVGIAVYVYFVYFKSN